MRDTLHKIQSLMTEIENLSLYDMPEKAHDEAQAAKHHLSNAYWLVREDMEGDKKDDDR